MRRMYSENQIKKIVSAAPEAIKEALVNQDLKVKTLEQSEANYELNLQEIIRNSSQYSSYFKSDTFYAAFKVINGILWFILSGKAVTKAESTGNKTLTINIPNDFKQKFYDKIYKADGKNMSEASDSADNPNLFITGEVGIKNINGSINAQNVTLTATGPTANVDFYLNLFGAGTYTDDGYVWLDIRFPLVLI